ncbi:PEGA domain-containing protein [bacterium]|nr:PEGA domain-containing protein [bacterium]
MRCRSLFYLQVITICFLLPALSYAQMLGTIEVVEAKEGSQMPFVVANPDISVLIVRSEVPGLSFRSTRGVLRVDEPSSGVYHVLLEPGTNVLTFSAPGYQSISGYRIVMPKKDAVTVDIKVLVAGLGGRGAIKIETNPPGATVTFNSVELQNSTPIILSDQPAGMHRFHFELEGYSPIDTSLMNERDKEDHFTFEMQRAYSTLDVKSTPTGAKVIFDGTVMGTTPILLGKLPIGEAQLVLELKDHEPHVQLIYLEPNKTRIVDAYLPIEKGAVDVRAEPIGAKIYLDKELIATAETEPSVIPAIPVGKHDIEVRAAGYEPRIKTVEVLAKDTSYVTFLLTSFPGTLIIASSPTGADVWLDGRKTAAKTPGRLDDIEPGEHQIELYLDGYRTIRKNVKVNAGDATRINETFNERVDLQVSVKSREEISEPVENDKTQNLKQMRVSYPPKKNKVLPRLSVGFNVGNFTNNLIDDSLYMNNTSGTMIGIDTEAKLFSITPLINIYLSPQLYLFTSELMPAETGFFGEPISSINLTQIFINVGGRISANLGIFRVWAGTGITGSSAIISQDVDTEQITGNGSYTEVGVARKLFQYFEVNVNYLEERVDGEHDTRDGNFDIGGRTILVGVRISGF